MKKAVVLLSGGIDSSTSLFWARSKGWKCLCLAFDYGQRHIRELRSAAAVARKAGCQLKIVKLNLPWKGSSLFGGSGRLPRPSSLKEIRSRIPSTYVPARNTIFLSIALSCAETIGANAVVIGANAVDFSGYPDCRPSYFNAFRLVARLGTKCGIKGRPAAIIAPLLKMNKAQIVRLAERLGVPVDLTWSCYAGGKKPCGKCDACQLREKGFKES